MTIGVNLANASLLTKRRELDFYSTPRSATDALIDFLSLPTNTPIWECACGDGRMSKVFIEHGYSVYSSDLYDYGYGYSNEDFLAQSMLKGDWIITNPPFAPSAEFIRKAHELSPKGFAFLLKSQYWHSKKRLKLFQDIPPTYVLPLTWRLDFLDGEKGGAPTMECCWNVWIKGETGTIYKPLTKGELTK